MQFLKDLSQRVKNRLVTVSDKNKKILDKIHVLVFPAAILYSEILLKAIGRTGVFTNLNYPILFGVGFGLFCAFFASLFSEKVNKIIGAVLLFVIGVCFIAECMIYRNMQYYMPIGAMTSVAGDVMSGYSSTLFSTIAKSVPTILVFQIPFIAYLIVINRFVPAARQGVKWLFGVFLGGLLLSGIGDTVACEGEGEAKYTSQYKFDPAVQYFGLTAGLELDVAYGIFGNEAADDLVLVLDEELYEDEMTEEVMDEELTEESSEGKADGVNASEETESAEAKPKKIVYDKNEMDLPLDEITANTSDKTLINMNEYVKSQKASSQNEYTGLFEGKNLILICAEAFSDAVIDPELTPTLYRLTHNGFYFSEFYQPYWGGSTSTGEYSMLMGIAPLRDIRTFPETSNKNLYFTMGNQLLRLGYNATAFHNGSYTYYSRNETHYNLGYEEYIAFGNGMADLMPNWGTDQEMFEGTVGTYIDNEPFSVYYMTGSGHFPYQTSHPVTQANIEYVNNIVGDKYDDITKAYLCAQMELEYGLAYLVEQLEAKGIADDTVIAMTTDHYPYGLKKSSTYGNSQDHLGNLYGEYPKTPWEQDRNAWVLWSGCLENEYKDMACEISEPTYSLDMVPTLSNLFGLEYDSRLLIGRDVFSDADPLVLWTDNSWVTDKGKYDADTGTFYPDEGVVVSDKYVNRINTIVANKLSFSGNIHNYDYYDILFGEKD